MANPNLDIPPHVGKFFKKKLGFTPVSRMRLEIPRTSMPLAYELAKNIELRDEYENRVGVHDGYVWFEDEADLLIYRIKKA